MATVRERCACGAEFEITDVSLPSALTSFASWRRTHPCTPITPPVEAMGGGTADLDRQIGFTTNGMDVPARQFDPWEDKK